MAGYELATAYVNLVTETGGLGKQISTAFGGAQKIADRAGSQSGQSFAKAFGKQKPIDIQADVKRAAANVEVASGRVKKARSTEEAASRKVQIAEAKLNELRASGSGKTSELLQAEDNLANAKSRHETATQGVTNAEKAAASATKSHKDAVEAADTALKNGGNSSTTFASKVKNSFQSFHDNAVAQVDVVGEKIQSGFSTAAKVAGGALAGIMGAAVVKGWGRLTAIEDATAKLKGLGNSAGDVDVIMENALASVKGTAFGLDSAATTAAGAVAAGIKPGEELERILSSVANSSAAAGMGMDEMGGIYNKVASIGKAQNDVLQQVADRGIPIYQSLADELGVTTDEVFKMASAGKIGFSDFESAMTNASGTVAEEMGKTTTGSLSNLWAALGRFGAAFLEGVFPLIGPLFTDLSSKLDGLTTVIGPIAEEISVKLVNGIKALVTWFQAWWPLLAIVGSALAGYVITIKVLRGLMIAWAAVQWALNAAMMANPLGLIVAGIAALVVGIVIAYNKIGWFRDIVNAAWAGIQIAVGAVVTWFQTYVWPVLQMIWTGIATAAMWLWQNVMVPAWAGIQIAVAAVVTWFQTYVAPVISAAINVVGAIFSWLYEYVVKPVFTGIKLYIQIWWTVISKIFNAVVAFVSNYLVPIFQLFWAVSKVVWAGIKTAIAAAWAWIRDYVFKPIMAWINDQIVPRFNFLKAVIAAVWAAIKLAISVAWNWVRDHVFSPIVAFVRDQIQPRFEFLKATVQNVWNAILSKIREVWSSIKSKAFDPLANAIKNTVPKAFEKGKDAIGRAWDKVRDVAKKPVRFVIDTIINKGIIGNFNKIASKFGVKTMPDVKLPKGFDGGGWTGAGPKMQPAGVVHADEFVVRKQSRKRFERMNPGVLDHINRTGTAPGYAGGGKVKGGTLWDAAQWWRGKGARASRHSWFNGGKRITSGHSNGSYHYKDQAVDFNYGPGGQNATEQAFFDKWIGQFQKQFPGIRTIWRAKNHLDHLHIDTANGANMGAGSVSDGDGGGIDFSFFTKPFEAIKDKIKAGVEKFGGFGDLVGGGARKMVDMPIQWIQDNIGKVTEFVGDVAENVKGGITKGVAFGKGQAWATGKGLSWGQRSNMNWIVSKESGWNPKAQNPRSTASGLPQFINSTSRQYLGGAPAKNFGVFDQLDGMQNYVDDRYNGWGGAVRFWKSHNYYSSGGRVTPTLYDDGGALGPGTHLVENRTRKPEYILPADVTDSLMNGGATSSTVALSEQDRALLRELGNIKLMMDRRELATAVRDSNAMSRRMGARA